ncbi:MAG: AzlD domain-containing protein [Clostridia bacterium]|nr:AzlD domain-containing protein [Clostridia bacterium]
MSDFWIYLVILSGSTYLVRALPFALVKNNIENRFIRSFLYYIPFAVLAAMTFPAVIYSTGNIASGIVGLLVGGVFAFKGKSLTLVAVFASLGALITELIIMII